MGPKLLKPPLNSVLTNNKQSDSDSYQNIYYQVFFSSLEITWNTILGGGYHSINSPCTDLEQEQEPNRDLRNREGTPNRK